VHAPADACWLDVDQPDARGQFAVHATPQRNPVLDLREAEVSSGEFDSNFFELPRLDRTQPVLRNSQRDRDVANTARASCLRASRANGAPPNCLVTTVADTGRQARQ
jgi:hypothetical protein